MNSSVAARSIRELCDLMNDGLREVARCRAEGGDPSRLKELSEEQLRIQSLLILLLRDYTANDPESSALLEYRLFEIELNSLLDQKKIDDV